MGDSVTIETDLFEHREVKPHVNSPKRSLGGPEPQEFAELRDRIRQVVMANPAIKIIDPR